MLHTESPPVLPATPWQRIFAQGRTVQVQALMALVGLTLLFHCFTALRHIDAVSPYLQHRDERPILGAAQGILKSGDYNPHFFNYPSAPIYAVTLGAAVGYIHEHRNPNLHGPFTTEELDDLDGDLTIHPRILSVPRKLFALGSALALLTVAFLAALSRNLLSAFFGIALLLLVPLFRYHSIGYLNVDIAAATASLVSLYFAARRCPETAENEDWRSVLAASAWAGLAVGCKYTMVVLAVPLTVSILLFSHRKHWQRHWLSGVGTAVVCFVAVCPYAVITPNEFLSGVAREVAHYASGHRGADGPVGWPALLFYLSALREQLGWAGTLACAVGIVPALRTQPRITLVLLSFGVALLSMLCGQPVRFERNILALLSVCCIWSGIGLDVFLKAAAASASRLAARFSAKPMSETLLLRLASTCAVLGLASAVFLARAGIEEDTRNSFAKWANRNISGETVFIPEELPFLESSLEGVEVRRFALERHPSGPQTGDYVLNVNWARHTPRARYSPKGETIIAFEGSEIEAKKRFFDENPGLSVVRIK